MKKVFIGVLAVMMLVAFTACEQPTIKYPANVSYITIEQTGDFVEGQTFKASNFAVYAHDTNGDSTIVPGANVTLKDGNASTELVAGKSYTAQASLKVAGDANDLTANLDFTAYAIESYTFTGVPALVAYVNDDDSGYVYAKTAEAMTASEYAAAVNAITVSVTYNGTSKMPLTLTSTEKAQLISSLCVVNEFGQKVTDDDFKVGTSYALAVGATKVEGEDSTPAVATNLTATGVEIADKTATKVEIQLPEGPYYISDPIAPKVVVTYSDNTTEEVSSGTENGTYRIVSGTMPSSVTDKAQTVSIVLNGTTLTDSVTLDAGQAYIAAAPTTGSKATGATVKAGTTLGVSQITVTATWTGSTATTVPAERITIINPSIPATATGNYPVVATVRYGKGWTNTTTISFDVALD